MLKDLLIKNRSYRRFHSSVNLSKDIVENIIESARYTCSARNFQPLRFIYSINPEMNERIFQTLSWAGALPNWNGPCTEEKPSAYIIITSSHNNVKWTMFDCGAAAQSMLLTATNHGFGGCIFGAINKKHLAEILNLSDESEIIVAIALGKPKEEVIIEDMLDEKYNYWRDKNNVHHVPKRKLSDLIIKTYI
jgi:nitroreductase